MIPPLVDGVLPDGVHDCDIGEVITTFGRFQRTDRRIRLSQRLADFLKEAKASGIVKAVIIDGSYVTVKDNPEDIDLLAVLESNWDPSLELRPFQCNVISKSAIRAAGYPFDLFAAPEGSRRYHELIAFFSQTSPDKHASITSRDEFCG